MGVGVDAISAASQCLASAAVSPSYTVPAKSGALVCNVFPGTPAAKAGDHRRGHHHRGQRPAGELRERADQHHAQVRPRHDAVADLGGHQRAEHTSSLTLIEGPAK